MEMIYKMKVIACGSRNWIDKDRITYILENLPANTIIIEGGARGADAICRIVAKKLEFETITENAEWEKYGKVAGPIRNRAMIDKYQPIDQVIAFHNDIDNSKGTKDMVNYALIKHIPVLLVTKDTLRWLP